MAFLPFLKAAAAAVAKTMNYAATAAAASSSFMAFALLDLSLHVRRSFAAEQLSRSKMSEVYNPPSRIQSKSHCGSMEEYQRRWKESIDDPYQFWGQIAKEFHWKVEPTKEDFVNYNFNVNDGPIKVCI